MPQLVSSYHDSVGKNAFWLLDWSPTKEGVLRPDHIARYAELGDWLQECYATPAASSTTSGTTMEVTVPAGHAADRVVLQEDLTTGQRVRAFTVSATTSDGAVTAGLAANGTSIGHKFIGALDKVYPAGTKLTLTITSAVGAAKMKSMEVFNCSRAPAATGCSYLRNVSSQAICRSLGLFLDCFF